LFVGKALIDQGKPDSFLEEVLQKAYRDAMTLVGALDPSTITGEPRFIGFIDDLGDSLKDIEKLERTLTPRAVKQFIPKDSGVSESGLPSLPSLPKLPKLPKLPSI